MIWKSLQYDHHGNFDTGEDGKVSACELFLLVGCVANGCVRLKDQEPEGKAHPHVRFPASGEARQKSSPSSTFFENHHNFPTVNCHWWLSFIFRWNITNLMIAHLFISIDMLIHILVDSPRWVLKVEVKIPDKESKEGILIDTITCQCQSWRRHL